MGCSPPTSAGAVGWGACGLGALCVGVRLGAGGAMALRKSAEATEPVWILGAARRLGFLQQAGLGPPWAFCFQLARPPLAPALQLPTLTPHSTHAAHCSGAASCAGCWT